MRLRLFPLILLTLASCKKSPPEEEKVTRVAPPTRIEGNAKLQISEDAPEIFQRTFWRRPTPADRILQAERREWLDPEKKLRQWQGFLLLEASPALNNYLSTNPFRLRTGSLGNLTSILAQAPGWLPSAAEISHAEIQSDPGGQLHLIRLPNNRLLTIGQGKGFRPPSK